MLMLTVLRRCVKAASAVVSLLWIQNLAISEQSHTLRSKQSLSIEFTDEIC